MAPSPRSKVELLGRLRGSPASAAESAPAPVEPHFDPWRRLVRRRLTRRKMLDGASIGALLGGLASAMGYGLHSPLLRWSGPMLVVLGAVLGWWVARRRRWSDERIALFVDGVLGAPEVVTTAVTLGARAPGRVAEQAADLLRTPRRGPPSYRRRHGFGLLAFASMMAFALWPSRAPVRAAPTVAEDVVKLAHVPGLDKVSEIERLPARDPLQKERLLQIAQEARELRRKLLDGVPRREALDRLGAIRRQLDAERRSFTRGDNALGLSAAASALRSSGFSGLADALEAGDMLSFDEMMERLANDREAKDRERAREALEQALEAARQKKADDLAKALERQKKRFDERSEQSDVLRELADALRGTPGDPGARAEGRQGTDAEARELADALRKGLEKLSPEERKRLAERLRERAERSEGRGSPSPRANQRRKQLQKDLSTPEGQKRLEERLRELAQEDPADDQERLDRGLDDAEEGSDEADDALGGRAPRQEGEGDRPGAGRGSPGRRPGAHGGERPGPGTGGPGQQGAGEGGGLDAENSGGRQGSGEHGGKSRSVDAETMKARARGKRHPGDPQLPAGGRTSTPGSDGAKATVGPTGDLAGAAAGELRAVDRAEIPESVRRQVKSYFE